MTDKVLVRVAEADLDRLLLVIESMVGLLPPDQPATDPANRAKPAEPVSAPTAGSTATMAEAERQARKLPSMDEPTRPHRQPSGSVTHSRAQSVTLSGAVTWSGSLPQPRTPRSTDEPNRLSSGLAAHARGSEALVAAVRTAANAPSAAASIVDVASSQSHVAPLPVRPPETVRDHPTPARPSPSPDTGSAANSFLPAARSTSLRRTTPRSRRLAPLGQQQLHGLPDMHEAPKSVADVAWPTPPPSSGSTVPERPEPNAPSPAGAVGRSASATRFVTLDELEERVADIIEIALVDAGIDLP